MCNVLSNHIIIKKIYNEISKNLELELELELIFGCEQVFQKTTLETFCSNMGQINGNICKNRSINFSPSFTKHPIFR